MVAQKVVPRGGMKVLKLADTKDKVRVVRKDAPTVDWKVGCLAAPKVDRWAVLRVVLMDDQLALLLAGMLETMMEPWLVGTLVAKMAELKASMLVEYLAIRWVELLDAMTELWSVEWKDNWRAVLMVGLTDL